MERAPVGRPLHFVVISPAQSEGVGERVPAVLGAFASEVPATAKVYVGWGKKDGANPNELVAVLTKELRVDRSKIGRIELRDAYSLVELPAQEVEPVAAALNGKTIRKKRVSAHVDRGVKPGSTPRSRRETRGP